MREPHTGVPAGSTYLMPRTTDMELRLVELRITLATARAVGAPTDGIEEQIERIEAAMHTPPHVRAERRPRMKGERRA